MKAEKSHNCVNCGKEISGDYCQHCGQKRITNEDKSLKYFLEEAFSSVFIADSKIWLSFRNLFFKPGALSKAYISGNRKRYLSPLRVFFFANLIYFLFPLLNTFNSDLNSQLNRQFYSKAIRAEVIHYLEKSGKTIENYRIDYERKSESNGKLLLIILVVFQAVSMYVLFMRKSGVFFTDFLAASAYFTSFYILFFLVIVPGVIKVYFKVFSSAEDYILGDNGIISLGFLTGIALYLIVFLKRAFSASNLKAVTSALVLSIFMIPCFVIYRFILFWITHLQISL